MHCKHNVEAKHSDQADDGQIVFKTWFTKTTLCCHDVRMWFIRFYIKNCHTFYLQMTIDLLILQAITMII